MSAFCTKYQEFTSSISGPSWFPTFRQLDVIGDIKGVRFSRTVLPYCHFVSDFESCLHFEWFQYQFNFSVNISHRFILV